jgi:hypothetical protein
MLAPGGPLDIRTHNSGSFLAGLFRDGWRGWGEPRHLHIFSPGGFETLGRSLGDVEVGSLRTSNRLTVSTALGSLSGATIRARVLRFSVAPPAAALALGWGFCFDRSGEELHATLRRLQ